MTPEFGIRPGRRLVRTVALSAALSFAALTDAGPAAGQAPGAQAGAAPAAADVNLENILDAAGAYCRKLQSSVLDFVCRETVVEKVDSALEVQAAYARRRQTIAFSGGGGSVWIVPRKSTIRSVYDYQCVRRDGVVTESRTLLEFNGRKKHETGAALAISSLIYHNALLGPANLFGAGNRLLYAFRVSGTERLDKRPVVRVEAAPADGAIDPLCLSGTAWVDPATGEILRIRWLQRPSERAEVFAAREKAGGGTLRLTLTTEFQAEKNGLRFPARLEIEEAYVSPRGRAFVRSTTKVEYSDFRFFTVEVDVR